MPRLPTPIGLPFILTYYIALRFLFHLAAMILVCMCLAFFGSLTELLRRASDLPDVSFFLLVQMAFFQLPQLIEVIIPFGFLLASCSCFLALGRAHEAMALRSHGISDWTLYLPAGLTALAAGVVMILVYYPVAALLTERFEQLEAIHIKGRTNTLAVSDAGLWLRVGEENGRILVVHALRADDQGQVLHHPMMLLYGEQSRILMRIDGDTAALHPGYWEIGNARITHFNSPPVFESVFNQPTSLTIDRVQESFAAPETFTLWGLRRFISLAQAAGFSAVPYRIRYIKMYALPFLLAGMTLLGAALAFLYVPRQRGGAILLLLCLTGGLAAYLFSTFVEALGASGIMPLGAAIWLPVGIIISTGMALLAFREG